MIPGQTYCIAKGSAVPLTALKNELRALARLHIDEGRLPAAVPTQA